MGSPQRLSSVDAVRGLVMVVMALDHVRDYFSGSLWFSPTDLDKTTPALFLTRWVTHLCAPGFMLLAGLGAALAEQRGLSKARLARFLLTRGLWLVVLELTLVRLGFYFTTDFHELQGLVMWALGWSMVLLAGLIWLPRGFVVAFGLLLVFGHNALDGVEPESFGPFGWLWVVLHYNDPAWPPLRSIIDLGHGYRLFVPYKIVPWVGVMALGYALGPLYRMEAPARHRWLITTGVAAVVLFIAVRAWNGYGEPEHWKPQPTALFTVFSFLNCSKYPPSLCYLLMTLGPILILLALAEKPAGPLLARLSVIGRVPLFFYLLHLPLIHGLAVLLVRWNTGRVPNWLFALPSDAQAPVNYGYNLPVVYAVWLIVVLALYPLCVGFAELKRRDRTGVLSYF